MTGPDAMTIFSRARAHGWVLEPEALQILAGYEIPVVEHCRAWTLDEARECAGRIGFPVALKVVSPAIMHKSDVNGVVTGVMNEQEVAEHFARFEAMEGFSGMLVARMLTGVELILGAKIDQHFGPVVLLGIGGTAVEIYQDVSIRMAPLTRDDVQEMAAGLRGNRILSGFRGRPPVSMEALTTAVMGFSSLIMDHQDHIASAEINPLICSSQCVAADARIILQERK